MPKLSRRTALKALAALPLVAGGVNLAETSQVSDFWAPFTADCDFAQWEEIPVVNDYEVRDDVLIITVRNVSGRALMHGIYQEMGEYD